MGEGMGVGGWRWMRVWEVGGVSTCAQRVDECMVCVEVVYQ